MKFPKKLSKERLSLLSPEDRIIYNLEHNVNKSPAPVVNESFVSDASEFDDMLDKTCQKINEDLEKSTVVDDFVDAFISEELDALFDELDIPEFTAEEFSNVKKEMMSLLTEEDFTLNDNDVDDLLTESGGAEGYDCGEWIKGLMPKVGWLGKWVMAGLGALGVGLGYLIVAGKDKLAMARLRRYMNRLVELTDQGVHKKKPWYSYLTWGEMRKNTGEYNNGCFRTIQETADRNMCIGVMIAAQRLGYFSTGDMMNMTSGGYPQQGGGIDAFKTHIVDKLNLTVSNG